MNNDELFATFLELEYRPKNPPVGIRDYVLKDRIILRQSVEGYSVLYLSSGASLKIPWKWTDLFLGLYYWGGDEIDWRGQKDFISLMTKLQTYHLGSFQKVNGEGYLGTLGDICAIGTGDFRKKYSKLSLPPFEWKGLAGTFDI